MSFSPESKHPSSTRATNRRSSSQIFLSDECTFQPIISFHSHQLAPSKTINIHERLYQESKLKKRCESNNLIELPKRSKRIIKKNFYQDSQLQKAQNRKNCLIIRRTLSQNEEKELTFTPTITKYNFSSPRRQLPLQDYLRLTEQYKNAYRYRLIRKHNKDCN
jgi:hypothetical protein